MNLLLNKPRAERISHILTEGSAKSTFISKISEITQDIDTVTPGDETGTHQAFDLTYKTPKTGFGNPKQIRIPLVFVEEFNSSAIAKDAGIDLNDQPHLRDLVHAHFLDRIKPESQDFGEMDILEYSYVRGTNSSPVYGFKLIKNGLLDPNQPSRIISGKNTRADIKTIIPNHTTSKLNFSEVVDEILEELGFVPELLERDEPSLFKEDFKFPLTHLKAGKTITVELEVTALDFYGSFDLTVVEAAVDPELEPGT